MINYSEFIMALYNNKKMLNKCLIVLISSIFFFYFPAAFSSTQVIQTGLLSNLSKSDSLSNPSVFPELAKKLEEKANTAFKFKSDILGNFVSSAENQVLSLASNEFTKRYAESYDETARANLTVLFHSVIAANADYMQVRFLDADGIERVRLDRPKGETFPVIVPIEKMQDKSAKSYFKNAKAIEPGDVWHSNVNLNMERGAIEIPIRPTFRVSTAVYSKAGFRGVVVINLIMDRILELLTHSADFDIIMIDQEHEIISHPNENMAWSKYLPNRRPLTRAPLDAAGPKNLSFYFPLSKIFRNQDHANLVLVPKKSIVDTMQRLIDTQVVVELSAQEKDWITTHPEIYSIALSDWPPIDFQDINGVHKGIAIDIIQLAASRVGLKIIPEFGPWADMLDKIVAGKIDLAPEIYYTEERARHLIYSKPYLPLYDAIFALPKSGIQSFRDLTGKTVAVEKGYAMQEILVKDYPETTSIVVDNTIHALQAVASGDADAYIGSHYVASYLINKHLIHGIQPLVQISETPKYLHFAVPKDRTILRDILEKSLATISDQEKYSIIRKYVADIGLIQAKTLVNLNAKEKAWLKKHSILRVHNEQSWAPFNFYEQNQAKGYSIDYMNLLAQRLGVEVSYITGPSWGEFLDMIHNKELDVMLNIVNTEDRRKYINFTDEYFRNITGIYVPKDGPAFTSLKELKGKTVSVPKGFFEQELLERYYPKVKLHLVRDNQEALEAVLFGKADAALGEMAVVDYLMLKNSITGLRLSGKVADKRFENLLNIGVRKDWPILRDILHKAMESITQEEQQELKKKWLSLTEPEDAPQIELSTEEQAWLASNQVLKLGYDTDWPPVEYIDKEGVYYGLSADYMTLIGKILGISIEPIPPQSWQKTLEDAKTRRIDLISAIMPFPERDNYLSFSQPYLSFPMVIVTRQEVSYIGDINELKGKKIAVVSDFASQKLLKDNHPDLKLYSTDNVYAGLEAVQNNNAFAFVGSLAAISQVLTREKIVGLKVTGNTPYSYELAIGIRNDQPILAGIIQKALDAISEEQRNEIYNRWVVVTYEQAFDYTMLWRALAAIALIFIWVVYWNRQLKTTVNNKTAELHEVLASLEEKVEERTFELREREKSLWDLYENAPVAYATLAVDGVFINHNRAFADLLKKPRQAFDSQSWNDVAPNGFAFFQATLNGQSLLDEELPIQLDNGNELFTTLSSLPIYNEQGVINEVRLTLVDITDRKAAQERFVQLMESAPDAMIVVDHQGTLVLVNSQVEKVFGYAREELLGEKIEILVPEDIKQVHVAYRDSYLEKPIPEMTRTALDLRALRKDGTEFPAEITLSPIENEDGLVVVAAVRDITARKEAERRIAESEERSRLILNSVGEGVFGVDNDGCITFANPKATELLGYSVEEMLGSHSHELLHHHHNDGSGYPAEECPMFKSLVSGDVSHIDNEVYWRKDGSSFDVEYNSTPIRKGENVIGAVLAFSDISLRKKAEQKLAETERRTRLLLKSVGEGVFGVNADGVIVFSNPQCSTLLGYSEDELLGSKAHPLFHYNRADGSEYPVHECWMYKSFTKGKSYRIDDEVLWRKDGSSFPVEYNSTPIHNDNELVGAVISFNDISERLKAQQERDNALAEISASIAYATNIQLSILPQKKCLDSITPHNFVIWEPRDQVGGDMYWCLPWGLGKLLALGDCTGHGVPGAFMTLIANGALEMATMETMPGDTGALLQRAHQLIQQELNQHLHDGESDDGLELGICYIDSKRKRLKYAGARFSLFYVLSGEVSEVKGDKSGIGYRGIPRDFNFNTHDVEYHDSGTFYMTSDGLTDQVGGPKRLGFGKRRLKALLCEIEPLPLEQQREKILQALEDYQGGERRRDDVSLVAFRLSV